MNNIKFASGKVHMVNFFSYDELADKIRIEAKTGDPGEFKEEFFNELDKGKFIVDDLNEFEGYTRVTTFFANYNRDNDELWAISLTIERDASTYEKVIERITNLERDGATMVTKLNENAKAIKELSASTTAFKEVILKGNAITLDAADIGLKGAAVNVDE